MVQVRVLIRCVFMLVITESENYHIYKTVFLDYKYSSLNFIKSIKISSHKPHIQ
jgi:hypothetical protein